MCKIAPTVCKIAPRVLPATVYRAADRRGPKRRRNPVKPEYRDWTKTIVALANLSPDDPVPLDIAFESAHAGGEVPPEAAKMPIGTAYRIARELGLNIPDGRTRPLTADYPMQAVQIDGSSSRYLTVLRPLEGGDYLLKLHRKPYRDGYKNKPIAKDRLRVLSYGIWDMCTGYRRSEYAIGVGESAVGACSALCSMLRPTGDPHRPMHGVPDDLWSDQGPLFKSGPSRNLIEALDMHLVVGPPYQKTRMGGVERAWRALWARFERSLFLTGQETITLSELNARLAVYEERENAKRASRTPVDGVRVSRAVAWTQLVARRPADNPLREFPENAMETMAKEKPSWVDSNGHVVWDRVLYETAWHKRHVIARRAMDGTGNLVIEDAASGELTVARRYEPRPYGEVRAVPKTPLEALEEEKAGITGADPYDPAAARERPAVVGLPPKVAPAAELHNPLEVKSAALSVEEGLRVFFEIYPYPMSAELRALVAERIRDDGLDRQGVVELAQELIALGIHARRKA